MRTCTLICLCLSFVCVPAWAGLSVGQQVSVQFKNVDPSTDVLIKTDESFLPAWTQAGTYNILIDGLPYGSFCMDPQQRAKTSVLPYQVVELWNAPVNDPLGYSKAQVLANVLSQWSPGMTDTDRAGMQLAVWEVVAENSDTYNLQNGSFQAYSWWGNGAISAGNNFLSSSSIGNISDYLAVGNGCFQDYVICNPVAVPVPSALLLAGMGVFVAGRLRKKPLL